MDSLPSNISALYSKNSPKILATLMRLVGASNVDLAEDILQDTFHRAMDNWASNGLPENPGGWLMLTAKRAALDHLRQSSNRLRITKDSLAPSLMSEWSRTYAI
ncbi:sigma factor [Agaribacter flavus]|uniref:Sigma factor n=1 Tax=Agaribacter flavus TaxID=1902781 RepID=A0ABV7FLB5_9ALTE